MTPRRPPRLARAALLAAAAPDERWFLVDDLDEEFAMIAARDGAARAVRWYWAQAVVSAPSLLAARAARRPRRSAGHTSVEGEPMFQETMSDLRHAARRARTHPIVAATVVISTALGVAATAAVFSVVNALLLRPLPLPEPERLVRIVGVYTSALRNPWGGVSFLNAKDIAARSRTIERLALYNQNWTGALLVNGEPRVVRYALAGEGLAEVLGLRPVLGRSFLPAEHVPGADAVALLTYDGWQRELGGDPAIVGRTIVVDSRALTVVGVLPRTSLEFPKEGLVFWAPLAPPTTGAAAWRSSREADWLRAAARLRRGVTMAQAQGELDALAAQLAREHPRTNEHRRYRAERLQDSIVGPVRPVLWLLAGAVGAVLLIACGNVALLLLAHAQMRRREFSVRAALGGAGPRITRQVLTESLALTALGGALGVAAAPLVVRAFLALYPEPLPRAAEIALDGRGVAVALAVIVASGLLAGLPAARQAWNPALGETLRDGGRTGGGGGGGGRRERRTGAVLIAGQVAFSVVLMFAAGVLLRSFWNLSRVELGYEPRGVLTFWLTPSDSRHPSMERLYGELDAALRALPGVTEVATSFDLPTAGRSFGSGPIVREGTSDTPQTGPGAGVQVVSPRLFAALGIPLRAGRDFTDADREGAPKVMVVNEAFAARMFPDGSALGRRITAWGDPYTIVGIVGDARLATSLWEPPSPEMYFALGQMRQDWRYVVIRTTGNPAALLPSVAAVVRRLDPTLPLPEAAPLAERVARSMAPQRFRGVLLGALGGLALLLSVIGIYGAASYAASRRTREIGIRLALGEDEGALRRRIVGGALMPAAVGTAIGGAAALAAGRWLEGFVLGVAPRDAATLAAVAALFLVVTTLAAYGPARRASRTDPTLALRAE